MPQPQAETETLVDGHRHTYKGRYARSMSLGMSPTRQTLTAISEQPRQDLCNSEGRGEGRQLSSKGCESIGCGESLSLSRAFSSSMLILPQDKSSFEALQSDVLPASYTAHKMFKRHDTFLGDGSSAEMWEKQLPYMTPTLSFSLFYDVLRQALTVNLMKAENLPQKSPLHRCNPSVMVYIVPHRQQVQQPVIRESTFNPMFWQGFEFCNLQLSDVKNQVLVFMINDHEM